MTQVGSPEAGDRLAPAQRALHDPIVVEDGHAVGSDPDVALQPVRAQSKAEREGLKRVLRCVRLGPTMRGRDRDVEQRGESLLHLTMMPRGVRAT